jgi:PAS domain S-box-containing protein
MNLTLSNASSSNVQRLAGVTRALAVVVATVGGYHLMQWLNGDFSSLGTVAITMKTNAALGLFLLGISLFLLSPLKPAKYNIWIARICAAIALTLGFLTLLENIFGWNFGIDQLLAQEPPGALGVINPNRMGMPASTSFTLGGLALLWLTSHRPSYFWVQSFGAMIALIGSFSLMGYAYGAQVMFGLAKYTAIAFPTAVTLVLLGASLLLIRPVQGIAGVFTTTHTGRELLFSFMFPFIVLAFLTGYLRLVGEQLGWYDAATGAGLRTVVFIVFVAFMLYRNAKELNKREIAQQSAQEAIRISEERFRGFMEQAPMSVQVFASDGQTVQVNKAWEELWGVSADNIADYNILRDPQLEAKGIASYIRRAFTGEAVEIPAIKYEPENSIPGRSRHRDSGRWVSAVAYPLKHSDGSIREVVLVHQDITARTHAEEAVQASEKQLRFVTEHAPVWLVHCDDQERYKFVNASYAQRWGLVPEQIVGKSIAELVGPKAYASLRPYVKAALSGKRVEFEEKIPYGQFGERWVHVIYAPQVDGYGKVTGFVGVIEDMTVRKEAERALRASEARYRTLFSSMDEGFCIVEVKFDGSNRPVDYRFIEVNPAFEKHTGLERAQGRWMRDIRPEHEQHWFDIYGKVAMTGEAVRFENAAKALDKCFDVYAFRIGEPGNWKVAILFNDISERKRAEMALKGTNQELMDLTAHLEQRVGERTEQLEQQTVLLRQLAVELTEVEQRERKRLAQVLHDHLQQLLVAARMRVELIERKTPGINKKSTDELRSYIEQAVQASRTLTAELRPPVLYESGLGAGLQFLARKIEDQYGLRVVLESSTDAEPSSDFIKAILYASAQELLFNTAKYAQVSECFLKLSRSSDDRIVVTLRDEGIGFNPDDIGRQIDGGFGLFSIRERIKALGGEFIVHSASGEGSIFEIRIPDKAEVSSPEAQEAPHQESLKRKAGKKGKGILKVLLADDHKIVRQSLATLLTAQSFVKEVIEAQDGEDVVVKFKDCHPDVVIMDLNMPKRNGIEATRILHHLDPTVRIIGLSVQTEQETAQTMIKAGAIAYFNKAADTDTLIKTIRSFTVSN